jgi:putative nucleotidyltransferase with HDIG domain
MLLKSAKCAQVLDGASDTYVMTPKQTRRFTVAACVLIALTVIGSIATSDADNWQPLWMVLTLAALGVAGDWMEVQVGPVRLSAGFIIVAIAMALLGPAPAVAICYVSDVVNAVRKDGYLLRGRRFAFLWNLGMKIGVLLGSLVIQYSVEQAHVSRFGTWYAVAVVAAISLASVINFTLLAVAVAAQTGVPIRTGLRNVASEPLAWMMAPNLLAAGVVILTVHLGSASLLLAFVLLGAFYLLLAELVKSRERSEEIEERSRQLASLQVGVLVTFVRTLSLRDRSTARHSAAVARYARAIATAAGCSEEDQRAVHTAGLLHDIGKFAFPDRILLASNGLAEDDWPIVKAHPVHGARLVARVDGYEEIANIIIAHHERMDGKGYPDGLTGEQIPLLSRMISIADIYDVITARDTYRTPVSRSAAIAELRRVAGTQLDADLVEVFIKVLDEQRLGFAHSEDADFEAELAFEERVRELAEPRRTA